MKEIKAYKSEDGEIFETEAEAIGHEQQGSLADFIENHDTLYLDHRSSGADEIAKILLENYSLTAK